MVFDVSPNAVLLVDADGTIVLATAAAEPLFGYTSAELDGMSVEQLLPRPLGAGHGRLRQRFFAKPERRTMGAGRELHCQRKDGSAAPVEISLSPVLLHDQLYVVVEIVDVTERQQLERQRTKLAIDQMALAGAATLALAKDELLAVLSHELRTPLNVILGWASLLRDEGTENVDLPSVIATLERSARRQAQLVTDILDASRMVQGRLELDLSTCDLAGIIDRVLVSHRPWAEAKGVRLRLRRVDPIEPVVGDRGRLEQVLSNLVSNAVKFARPEGIVEIDLIDADAHILLRVDDDGIGIEPSMLQRIFDRFTQEDGSMTRAHGGLGLGLAIVRHLVDLHGGDITAQSGGGPGPGAPFTIRLPYRKAGRLPATPSVGAEPARPDLSGRRILVVDDDPDSCALIRDTLPAFGARVDVATSGAQGIAALEAGLFDALVSDVLMPEVSGYDLIGRLREREATTGARLPVVALTAYAGSEGRPAALRAGFDVHLEKPIVPRELARVLQQLIGKSPLTP